MGLMQQFQQQQPTSPQGQAMPDLRALGRMARGDTQALVSSLARANPGFASFMESNRGKTPRQVAAEHGIDLDRIISGL